MTSRKIQSEIERTLKKVQEGIEIFDALWDKVHSAPTQVQKERHESDLKKEIKKLQRLREQIKNWQSTPEIKDKTSLNESRKIIEGKMEAFKVVEKETKTKAYSKEGLALPIKTDPAEVAKHHTISWINTSLQSLQELVDECELEVETTESQPRGGRKKSTSSRHSGDAHEAATQRSTRHKWHIATLEQILRMMDNDELVPADVDETQDTVEYYIEEKGVVDEEEDDHTYESLDLPVLDTPIGLLHPSTPQTAGVTLGTREPSVSVTTEEIPAKVEEEGKSSTSVLSGKTTKTADLSPKKSDRPRTTSGKPLSDARTEEVGGTRKGIMQDKTHANAPSAGMVKGPSPRTGGQAPAIQPAVVKTLTPVSTAPVVMGHSNGGSSSVGGSAVETTASAPHETTKGRTATHGVPGKVPATAIGTQKVASPIQTFSSGGTTEKDTRQGATSFGTRKGAERPTPLSEGKTLRLGTGERITLGSAAGGTLEDISLPSAPQGFAPQGPRPVAMSPATPHSTDETIVESLPLSDTPTWSAEQALRMFSMSAAQLPQPFDAERRKPYVPPNPYATMSWYPQEPHSAFCSPDIFSKFDTDTLFFIFYYQQATYQQFLAARELKRQSWRYHKKFLTWFQRHNKPTTVNEDCEQGNYLYFDYENGWEQRVKQGFTFQYNFLEDELGLSLEMERD